MQAIRGLLESVLISESGVSCVTSGSKCSASVLNFFLFCFFESSVFLFSRMLENGGDEEARLDFSSGGVVWEVKPRSIATL